MEEFDEDDDEGLRRLEGWLKDMQGSVYELKRLSLMLS